MTKNKISPCNGSHIELEKPIQIESETMSQIKSEMANQIKLEIGVSPKTPMPMTSLALDK